MPYIASENHSSTEKNPPTSWDAFKNAFTRVKAWVVKNPIRSIAILAALTASIAFTGGALLASAGVLAVMAKVAIGFGLITGLGFAFKAANVQNPYKGASTGLREDLITSNTNDGKAEKTKWSLMSGLTFMGVVCAFIAPIGVIACAVISAVSIPALVEGAEPATSSPSQEKPTPKEERVNHSYNIVGVTNDEPSVENDISSDHTLQTPREVIVNNTEKDPNDVPTHGQHSSFTLK